MRLHPKALAVNEFRGADFSCTLSDGSNATNCQDGNEWLRLLNFENVTRVRPQTSDTALPQTLVAPNPAALLVSRAATVPSPGRRGGSARRPWRVAKGLLSRPGEHRVQRGLPARPHGSVQRRRLLRRPRPAPAQLCKDGRRARRRRSGHEQKSRRGSRECLGCMRAGQCTGLPSLARDRRRWSRQADIATGVAPSAQV